MRERCRTAGLLLTRDPDMAIDFDHLWDPNDDEPRKAGVSAEDIARWEIRHALKLPDALARALRKQNGGLVRYSSVWLHPLNEITWADKSALGWVAPDAKEVPNRDLVVTFANDDDEPTYFLNYNANGPNGEPSVYSAGHDPPEFRAEAKTVAEFLSALSAVSAAPAVDWEETRRLEVVLLEETVNQGPIRREIVLGRSGEHLVLYSHDMDPYSSETYSKTTIPEPLNPWFAFIFKLPPFVNMPYFLHLSPRDPTGVVFVESTRTRDGNWKSRVDDGFPLSVDVESHSRSRLKALRKTLLGRAAAAKTGLVLLASLSIIITLGVLAYLYR